MKSALTITARLMEGNLWGLLQNNIRGVQWFLISKMMIGKKMSPLK